MIRDFLAGVTALWPLITLAIAVLTAMWAVDLHDRLNRTAEKLTAATQKVDDLQAQNIRLGSLRLDLLQQFGNRPPLIRRQALPRIQREWEARR